ncbi:hypothetical protein [Micromonospora wenchangensis]|uniref:hypothetical protein n=1 Tax=Micromonospora wenchangensis TaxID=1185415 RepID=UPI00380B373C
MTIISPADYISADPTADPTVWTIPKMRAAITILDGTPVNLTVEGFKQRPIIESQVRLVNAHLRTGEEWLTMEWGRDDEVGRSSVRLNEILTIEATA